MPSSHLQWTDDDFTVKDFAYSYEHQLPAIVCVSQGYCGYGEDFFTFSLDEEYRVDRINKQTRVIAVDESGTKYSIPVSYPVCFKVLGKARSKELGQKAGYLDEILSKCEIKENSSLCISPEEGDTLKFWHGADRRSQVNFEQLEILSTYEEKYIVMNPMIGGRLFDGIIVPYFLNIKVKIAEGLKNGGHKEFNAFMEKLTRELGSKNENLHGNKEIMIFEQDAGDDYGVYASLEPSSYVASNQVKTLRKGVDHYEKLNKSKKRKRHMFAPLGTSGNTIKSSQEQQNQEVPNDLYDEVRIQEPNIEQAISKGKGFVTPHLEDVKPTPPRVRVKPQPPVKPTIQHGNRVSNTTHPMFNHTPPARASAAKSDANPTNEKIYENLADVPKTVSNLSVVEVADCLRLINLEGYASKFADHLVDGSLIGELDADILCDDFGMSKFEALKTIKFFKSGWRPK